MAAELAAGRVDQTRLVAVLGSAKNRTRSGVLKRAGGDRARVVVERRAVGDLAAHRSAVVLAVRALLTETRKDSAIDADESYIPRELAVKTVN